MKKKQLIISILIITLIIALIGFTKATNIGNYAIQIVDDGSNNLNADENGETSITKKIIEDNNSNIVYQVDLKNNRENSASKEMSILIDTSRSMDINDADRTMYTIASEFVESIFTNVPDIKMSLSDTTGIKINMSNINQKDNIKSTILALEKTNGNSIDEGIDIAKTTFSSSANKKYLVIFTDATDKITKVPELEENGIEVVTILTDMTRASYEVDGVSTVGLKYMMDSIDIDYICAQINNSISNVTVTDVFTQDIIDYFDFEVVSKNDSDTIEKTNTGYIWKTSQLKAGETMTLKFRLTLKENKNVPNEKIYKDLYTSENMNVEYSILQNTQSYDVIKADSPIIMICEKYDFIIQAVSEENTELPVEGVNFHVVGKDESGKVVYENTLTTNALGKVEVKDLKTTGKIIFTVTPTVNLTGYDTTDATDITINNNITNIEKRVLEVVTDGLETDINNDTRKVTVKYPINTQKFNLEVNLTEKNNSGVKIGRTEFRLIQPTFKNKYEYSALYGTTNDDGQLIFTPVVMAEPGTYDYILSQTTEHDGYESMGNVTIRITFGENGIIENIVKKYNDNVDAYKVNDHYGIVTVQNNNILTDVFNFEINLKDKETNYPLEGASYTIEAKKANGDVIRYTNQKTDIYGKINLELPGSGYIQVKITEETPALGYKEDKQTKEIILYRNEGFVQYVAKTTPSDLSTEVPEFENKVIVNLASESSSELNVIQIKLTDSQEWDIPVQNVNFTLKSLEGPIEEVYTGTTDENGIVNFIIQPQTQGVYAYKLEIDNSTVPNGYSPIEEEMAISVEFDENRYIKEQGISDAKGTFIDFDTQINEDKENQKIYHIGIAHVGLEMSETDAVNFKIKLSDDLTGEAVEGAKYDIKVTTGDLVRTKSGAKTDSEGIISTRILPADRVEIEIKQVSSRQGYVIDDQVQTIILEKSNGVYRITYQDPYDLSDGKNGATIEGTNIIFKHTNRKKDGSDVRLNLYINKMDKEDNLVGNLPLRIYSDTLRNTDGSLLNVNISTDDDKYVGYAELEKLIVPEVEQNGEREDILYIVEKDTEGNDKESTLVKIKLAFRFNENKEIVELTNAESTWGNRLIKSKTFNGYETNESYESNLYLDIYTNYDDVGNFSMDFIKKDTEGTVLSGAKYDIVITRPDGTNLIRGVEITDTVEYSGIFVTKGTTIEITEKEAPIGYEINEHTDIIKIIDIDSVTGEVTAQLTDTSYSEPRTIIEETQQIPLEDGTIKTNINVALIDKELNNFKMGISTKDSVSLVGIPEATYRVSTSKGAQIDTPTGDKEGTSNFKIGASFSNQTVSYEIKQLTTGEYYKKLDTPIILNVVFGDNKQVDAEATMAAQTDTGYGTTWEITSINKENGNYIDIQIKNEPQDPLTVEMETIDNVTSNKIENVSYKITPSINLLGEGADSIEVGYVSPNSTKIYNITQITELESHQTMEAQTIKVVYDKDGNVIGTPIVSGNLEVISVSGKTIQIRNKLEPKVPFILENLGYFNDTPLANAQFEITLNNEVALINTGINGSGSTLIGELGTNENITYHVHQVKAPTGYAKIDDFDIKVHYDADRNIDNVELVNVNRFVEVSYKTPSENTDIGYNGNDKGIVKINVKSYPELKMNIENVDRLNNTTKLAGTVYQVESTINTKDDEVITEDDGIGIAHLDKTAIDDTVTYTIKETRPAALYQTMEQDVKVEVTFDTEGYVVGCEVVQGNGFAAVSKIENITTPEENFIVNVQIKSNKMLNLNITSTDSVDSTYYLENNGFEATATFNDEQISKDQVVTDNNGQATLRMDRCLANETIVYTIHQTKKNAGYQFPEEDMKIEITYDSNGKIISDSVRLLQGSKYVQILNIDADNFNIDLKIVNEETKQFGVNITTIDKYDDTVKLEGVNYNAYLMTDNYAKDENYTGETTTDANGEGYIQFNKYDAEYGETRILRLEETNVPDTHREIRASILINLQFNDNGEITDTTVPGGLNSYIGWVADGRFVKVTHTKYTVVVTIMHYPYLNLNLVTEDMYTGERLEGKYKISTHYGPGGYYQQADTKIMEQKITEVQDKVFQEEKRIATLEDLIKYLGTDTSVTKIKQNQGEPRTVEFTINNRYLYTVDEYLLIIDAQGPWVATGGTTGYTSIDYIGNGLGEFLEAEYTTTTDGEYDTKGIGPTEQSTTQKASRTFYIYEQQEPTSPMQYQQYRPQYVTWYYSIIIGKITVNYDTKGRIESYSIDKLTSNNNIDYNFIEVNKIDGYNLEIKVKYAPITTMEVTAIDTVSKVGLSNVRVAPYGNPEYSTRNSYEYRTIGYYTTDSKGQTSYTYWGANINDGQNEYYIDTSLMSYKGYYETGRIKIKVSYDENGRIAAADVISTDENGMPNAEVVGFENNKLKINILYYRKFNIQINKKDLYDENTKISAQFRVTSSKGETKDINSGDLTLFGIIRPRETVKYTLSEIVSPSRYVSLDNLEFYVTFGEDGSIKKAWSDNKLFESIYERNQAVQTNVNSVKDLEINIKNEPQFSLKMNLVDKFYNEKVLPNVTFSIENDKGELATGNPTTNVNGLIDIPVGKIYQNDKITYTIIQTSEANGYTEKNIKIQLEVEFNENGKVKDYKIISGNEYVNIESDIYKNQRFVELTAMLTPKDIKLGIKNYNDVTNEAIPNVTYKITSQEIIGGSALKETQLVTNSDGTVIDIVDEVKQSPTYRVTNYTISEINVPNTYRKIQDVVLQVRYGEDGRMEAANVISNPSDVIIKPATGGKLQYLNEEDVHILLEIPNDNAYDLVIKNEDKNYQGLGIEGTLYDISINGETISEQTDENGIARIVRTDSGKIQIQIAENTIGIGYKADNNNQVTLDIEKGLDVYSLDLTQNSNPIYAEVTVDEEYGIITVTFKNETKSSLTLIKDVAAVKYNITAKEKLSDGTYTDEKVIGTDITDTIAQEKLYYELGVTPQNKTIVYTFEEVDYPGDYHQVGTFEVTVEYDMYGDIKKISDNSDRVDVIEEIEGSHDIIVIVSEYNSNSNSGDDAGEDSDNEKDRRCSITIVKDNPAVRYEISSKEVDELGNYSNEKIIGSDLDSIEAEEQLYYELGKLQKRKTTMIFTIKELSIPDGYEEKGKIEVTAKVNEDGFIYEISDNCDKAEAKLIPTGSNDIVVVIGEEYGSLTLIKDNADVKYKITSNGEIIFNEKQDGQSRRKLYVCIRNPIDTNQIKYEFSENYTPEDYDPKGTFEVLVEYDDQSKITNIVNNDEFIRTQENPEGSNNVFVKILSEEELNKYKDKYTIKVVSQEVETNLRINESIFDIEINQGEGKLIQELTGASTANVEKKGYILEKGVIKTESINKSGDVYVEINQTEVAEGYIFGNQKTSGTVHLNVQYDEPVGDEKVAPQITVIDKDGLEVSVDNTNKEITIKVLNEPEVIMEILTNFETKDEEGNKELTPQEGVHYTITSKVQTSTEITDTDLNVTSKETDEEGKTKVAVGIPYVGKAVIYTISQEESDAYDKLGDIEILVQYDTKGLIKYYEVVSNPDNIEIVGNLKERVISIEITNKKSKYSDTYNFVLEKHHIDNDEYGKLISGIKFRIHVKEEYGEEVEWDAITDEDGLITSKTFSGYGRLKIDITELETKDGFKLDGNTYTIRVRRDKNTGLLTPETSDNINFEFGENYSSIIAKPVNEPRDNSHTIVLNKTDLNKNSLITDSSAEFEVTRIETENQGTEEEPDIVEVPMYLGKIETDEKGKARLENLDSPSTPGTYTYIIKETKAPEGYVMPQEETKIEIIFDYDTNNNMIVKEANIINGEAKVISVKEKLLNIAIYNINKDDLNKFKLDINKIDGETGEPIEAEGLFKMWLPNGYAMYSETSTQTPGKLDKFYLETNAEEKVDLNSLSMPEEPGTLSFVIREVIAPEGYARIEEDMKINVEFDYDENQNIIIKECTLEGEAIELIGIEEKTKTISLNILNKTAGPTEFTVHYDANDNGEGTTVPEDQIKQKDVDLILNTMEPVREGYVFKGWGMLPTSTTADFNPGDTYNLNQDITLYAIWEKEEDLYLKSTEYLIGDAPDGYKIGVETEYKDGDMYISRILPGTNMYHTERTTVKMFKENITTNAETIEVIDTEGNVVEDNKKVGTGMTLKLTKGDKEISILLVVMGDLDGDGRLMVNEPTTLQKEIILGGLTDIQKIAGDVNCDGKIKIDDITFLKQIISGKIIDQDAGERADFSNLADIYKK